MATKTKTNYEALWQAALDAGNAAAADCTPTPMIVGEAKSLFTDEIDYSKPVYYVADGACGFAWINFKGNTAFGRWAKAKGVARKGYPTGLTYWVSAFNQSMQKKEAFAYAFAAVLREAGIEAYAGSRLD